MRHERLRVTKKAAVCMVALFMVAWTIAGCADETISQQAPSEATGVPFTKPIQSTPTQAPDPPTPRPVPTMAATPTAQAATPTPLVVDAPARLAWVLPTDRYEPPDRDLAELAIRLRGAEPDDFSTETAPPMSEGDKQDFWITNLDDGTARPITATLQVVSDNAYWFVDDTVTVVLDDLGKAADIYESQVRPSVVSTFGDITNPGLDGDPRLLIIHTTLDGAAGYFGSKDSFSTDVHPYSNGREIIYLDSRAIAHGIDTHLAIVTHELQHAVHFDKDVGEESWVNEGLSEVATQLAGYRVQSPRAFMHRPDTQLNYWPDSPRSTIPHYGASALFFTYLAQRAGGPANLVDLVNEPLDGIAGVESFLNDYGLSWLQVFADWVVANYLDADDSRYGYADRDVGIGPVRTLMSGDGRQDSLPQYSARYYRLDTNSTSGTISFTGDTEVRQVATDCVTGLTCWWSGRGDGIDTKLTREFDLTGLDRATLEFQVWHEIEEGWDYAYVEVSDDDGETWHILEGAHTTTDNPSGNAYGPGYTGASRDWKQESIDLTKFVGGPVLIRFEYVTDDAVYLDGMLIDDVAIPELDFIEVDGPGDNWRSEGFNRAGGKLAQGFIVQVVTSTPDGEYTVSHIPLGDRNNGEMQMTGLAPGVEVVVIVSPITPATRHEAGYVLEFREQL